MKNLLLIETGGTISSSRSKEGLAPYNATSQIEDVLKAPDIKITYKQLMSLDSSNIQPEEWKAIAKEIFDNLNYDGIIITHGTDTMAYTATMMCFMIQNPSIPIVFTGAQLPISHPLSDASHNLIIAREMAISGTPGIFIAFDRKIMYGCRAAKVRTTGFSAFESINYHSIATINASGLVLHHEYLIHSHNLTPVLNTNIETNVFLFKLTPTTNPDIIDKLIDFGIKGIVIEGYGAGGIPFIRRDFVTKIKTAIKKNIPVVLCSQCLYEQANYTIYEVGNKALETGAIEALDMTSEACVCKLMYALGQSNDIEEVKKIFLTPISCEIMHKK